MKKNLIKKKIICWKSEQINVKDIVNVKNIENY